MKKRILITGATGFIGQQCLAPLKRLGFEIHCISRSKQMATASEVWHELDFFDVEKRNQLLRELRPSHLLHLAWVSEHGKYWSSPLNLEWLNHSLDFVREFKKGGGIRCVAAGTCAEYDPQEARCVENSSPLRPNTLYGESKLKLSNELKSLTSQDFSVAWGRIFHLYGPGEDARRLAPTVISHLLAGKPANCTAGTQVKDFAYVKDIASIFAALSDSNISGPINLASGNAIAVRDFVMKIGELIGKSEFIRLGAIPMPEKEVAMVTADISRLKNELGFKFEFDLERGLRETIDWWKNNEDHN